MNPALRSATLHFWNISVVQRMCRQLKIAIFDGGFAKIRILFFAVRTEEEEDKKIAVRRQQPCVASGAISYYTVTQAEEHREPV